MVLIPSVYFNRKSFVKSSKINLLHFIFFILEKIVFDLQGPTEIKYSWWLNSMGVRVTNSPCSWKTLFNFWLIQNLTKSLLLTGSLTNNINCWLIHTLYIIYWMLGAGALGRPRGMVWGGRREEGSGWGTHVYLWRIHFDILQN